MRHNIKGGRGNCSPQDDTEILSSVQDQCEINSRPTGISDVAIARRYDLALREPSATEHDYCDVPNAVELSDFKEAVISYIAGFVAKMVEKNPLYGVHSGVVRHMENEGGLALPSLGLLKICEETEKCIIRMLDRNGGSLPHGTGISNAIAITVLPVCVESGVFNNLDQHMFDSTAVDNHVFTLIKCCSQSYVTIRMHHLSKLRNARMHEKVIRQEFKHLILYKHQ